MLFDSIVNYSKEKILIKITAFFWLLSKGMSWKLWLSDRILPVIPPFELSPNLNNTFHLVLFAISMLALFSIVFFTSRKRFIWLVILLEIASCFLDQMRWQPWEYQYLLLFVFYLFYKKDTNQFLELAALLIGFTYIYSGLHKFNGGFLFSVWENMILRNFFHFEEVFISKLWVHYSGLLLPFVETLIGLGLLFRKNKLLIVYIAIGMHVLLLTILIGNNQNSVVWPWNIAMILYAWVLFSDNKQVQFKITFLKNYFNSIVFTLIGILPLFSFFGLWDNYLSFNLYSGNVKQLNICISAINKYPELKPYISSKKKNLCCKDFKEINLNFLALKELNVPVYPEEKTFYKLKKEWRNSYPKIENTFISYWYPYKKENYKEIQ